MPTRAQMRNAVRIALDDTGVTPLFSDELINQAINESIARYSQFVPRPTATEIAVAAGDLTISLDATISNVRRVFDDNQEEWNRLEYPSAFPCAPASTCLRSWRIWGQSLLLSYPASRTGLWRIEHLATRSVPEEDSNELDIEEGDDHLITRLAFATAIQKRAVDDAKRMPGKAMHPLTAIAESARTDVERQLQRRNRKVRSH